MNLTVAIVRNILPFFLGQDIPRVVNNLIAYVVAEGRGLKASGLAIEGLSF